MQVHFYVSKHIMTLFLATVFSSYLCVAYHPLCARAANLCVEVHYGSLCCAIFPSWEPIFMPPINMYFHFVLLFYYFKLEDDDKIHLMLLDEDEDPCIRLLLYCKKHRQPSAERPSLKSDPNERAQVVQTNLASSSGCARTGKRTSNANSTWSFLMFSVR